jgi:hypothetical protein
MNNLKNRLGALEEKNDLEMFRKQRAAWADRSEDEIEFYATHGCFPESASRDKREFVVDGWKTTVILERV